MDPRGPDWDYCPLQKVPSLLKLLARTLSNAKIPKSLDQAQNYSLSDWLDAAPVLAGVFTCVAVPCALLLADQAKVDSLRAAPTPADETISLVDETKKKPEAVRSHKEHSDDQEQRKTEETMMTYVGTKLRKHSQSATMGEHSSRVIKSSVPGW